MTAKLSRQPHYGYVMLVLGLLVLMSAMGLGRWAYPPILPSMKAGLGLSYTQAGMLSMADTAGYTGFAIVCGVLASRIGPRRVIAGGLLLASGGMVLAGISIGFEMALLARFVSGIGAAGASIAMFSLVSRWFARRRRGLVMGVLIAGTPLSLLLTGQTVPRLLSAADADGWRYAWVLLGLVALATCVAAAFLLRNHPSEKGLQPLWADREPAVPHEARTTNEQDANLRTIIRLPIMRWLMVVYAVQGFAYVAYATFFISHLLKHGLTMPEAGNLWTLVGFLALIAAPSWGTISDRLGRRSSIGASFVMLTLALALFALAEDTAVLTGSVVLYGLSVNAVGTIVPASVSDYVGERGVPAALGLLSFVFGIAISLAPVISGAVADAAGSFAPAFLFAGAIAAIGIPASWSIRPHGAPQAASAAATSVN